jgi:hypothetical protein
MKSSSSFGNVKILCTSSIMSMRSDTSSFAVEGPAESFAPGVDLSSSEKKESGESGESGEGGVRSGVMGGVKETGSERGGRGETGVSGVGGVGAFGGVGDFGGVGGVRASCLPAFLRPLPDPIAGLRPRVPPVTIASGGVCGALGGRLPRGTTSCAGY